MCSRPWMRVGRSHVNIPPIASQTNRKRYENHCYGLFFGQVFRSFGILVVWLVVLGPQSGRAQSVDRSSTGKQEIPPWMRNGRLRWVVGEPLVQVETAKLPDSPEHPWVSVKDPSIVRFDNRWHLFCSLRRQQEGNGRIRIGYSAFEEWANAGQAEWHLLELAEGYHAAPQVFYFEPQSKWYLIYQAADEARNLAYGPCYSTNSNIADPMQWTAPQPLYVVKPGTKAGLDYWVICDEQKAHLFFTSLNGQLWHAETRLESFPDRDWSDPEIVLTADIFEASHTYRLSGTKMFLTLVEAQHASQGRYYKAFLANSLSGAWTPLMDRYEAPFASPRNVGNQSQSWTGSYSHGELIRLGYDQRLEIDPMHLEFLFQGASDNEYQNNPYGLIPWRLGVLKMAAESP